MIHIPLTNPYQPCSEPLLTKVYDKSVEKMTERDELCFADNCDNHTARLFTSIIYSNVVRIEYANDKLREAMSVLRDEKSLYRHEIKKHAMALRKDIAMHDSYIAWLMNVKGEGHLDYYDELCRIFFEQFDRLYQPFYFSILQFCTGAGIPCGTCMAHISSSMALIEFAYKMMMYDSERYYMEAPPLRNMPNTLKIDGILHHMKTIYCKVLSQTRLRSAGFRNINDDRNVVQSRDNLFQVLASPGGIENYLSGINVEDLPERPADMPEVSL